MAIILQCSTVSQFYIQIAFFKYMEVHNNFRIDYRDNTYNGTVLLYITQKQFALTILPVCSLHLSLG